MKKIFGLLMIAGMMSFVACGPSAEELAEKAKQDSIHVADSLAIIAAEAQAAAEAAAAEAQAIADAAQAQADSIAAASAPKKK